MSRGERWRRFFSEKGWIVNDVISGDKENVLQISLCCGYDSTAGKPATFEKALILHEFDILCYESPNGTVFFQWDDIAQVTLAEKKAKRGWL
ncbi:MAG: hypothetical protein DRP45_03000 [Candidatus Zixiibacteriota bacterium]|nr:MAG: hypothetical protein DRP45_03000 [candidate division Zixibacteria bacterium]